MRKPFQKGLLLKERICTCESKFLSESCSLLRLDFKHISSTVNIISVSLQHHDFDSTLIHCFGVVFQLDILFFGKYQLESVLSTMFIRL